MMDTPIPRPEEPPADPIPEQPRVPSSLPELGLLPPAPLPQMMAERYKGVYWSPARIVRGHLLMHALAFGMIAASMTFQPERYNTANLPSLTFALSLVPVQLWAGMFALAGLLKLLAYWRYPTLSRMATVIGLTLVTFLTVLFLLAWLLGPATVFLTTFGGLDVLGHIYAICHLDGRRRWRVSSS